MVACIICGHKTGLTLSLSSADIQAKLAALYAESIDSIPPIPSYEIRRCPACTVEFSWPMTPGDDHFYSWIVHHNNYYPSERWGWSLIRNMLAQEAATKIDGALVLVDVGCGSGAFLNYVKGIRNLRAIGLDMTQSSVDFCRSVGLEAYCSDILRASSVLPDDVAFLTAFHCLEHVPDPVSFLEAAKSLLKGKGRILITTPYSPMSFEATWHDPLNYPPHHLTRWNMKSYQALAKRVSMTAQIIPGPSVSVMRGTLRALLLHAHQTPFLQVGKLRKAFSLAVYCLINPLVVLRELRAQAARPELDGRPPPDEVMVIFSLG